MSSAGKRIVLNVQVDFADYWRATVGFMIHMPAMHAGVHIGQIQVARRNLGKPVLF